MKQIKPPNASTDPLSLDQLLPNAPTPHIGMIVPDLLRAMEYYGKLFGWRFAPPRKARHELVGPNPAEEELFITFTLDAPAMELIEARPGTLWSLDRGILQHFGFWVHDLEQSGETLQQAGFKLLGRGRRVGAKHFSYHYYENADGLTIEIGDRRYEEPFNTWLEEARSRAE